jgi:hypothetical protein
MLQLQCRKFAGPVMFLSAISKILSRRIGLERHGSVRALKPKPRA